MTVDVLRGRISTLITIALLIAGSFAFNSRAATSEGEQIYVLRMESAGLSQQQYAFRSLGIVPGARKLAVPENGAHILVLTDEGELRAWGDNSSGQLGTGDLTPRDSWASVKSLDHVSGIAAGAMHSVALKSDGSVWTWGANQQGQLGSSDLVSRTVAGPVAGLSDVKMIAAGWAFTLALRSDGTVWVFGANTNEVAPGETRQVLMTPVLARGLTGIEAIAVYQNRGYAKDNQGRIWVWGKTEARQNSAVRELTGADVENLPARVARILNGAAAAAGLQAQWQTGIVRVSGSALEVVQAEKQSRYGFDGSVIDMDWGWAVGLITDPAEGASASSNGQQASSSAEKGKAGNHAPVATMLPRAAAPPPGTLGAYKAHRLILSNGSACATGENDNGELGDGTAVDRWTPVPVTTATGLTGISRLATGWYHSVAVKTDGTVWAWGYNANGELGDNTTSSKRSPFPVTGLSNVVGVAAGQYHSVAVKGDGTVWTWGYNANGQLGDGTTTQRTSPVQSILISGVTAVAAGNVFTLVLKSDGTVWGWGYNGYGQLGDGTTTSRTSAVQVAGLTNVIAIAAGGDSSMALKSDGTVWAWGYNGNGQLGDGSTTSRSSIVTVSGLSGVTAIAEGGYHSLAVKSDGTVWAWGYNGYGELGDATIIQKTTPVQVSQPTGFSNLAGVAAGEYYSLALKSDGTIWAWGRNDSGQLGNGSTNSSVIPVASSPCGSLPALGSVVASPFHSRMTANQAHSLGIKADGSLWAWGENDNGQLGDGTTNTRLSPVASSISGVAQVSTGWYHTLALKTDRTVWAWGYNANGELGDGSTVSKPTPIQVHTITGVIGVAAGQYHSAAVKGDGTVWTWGYNANGQLGDGTTTQRISPVQSILISGVTAVATGNAFTLALKSDGTVWGWGYNGYGQLGDGTTTSRTSAVQVVGLTNVIAIAAAGDSSMALRSDGTVWAWGYNGNGQLGDGSNTSQVKIVRVSDLTNVTGIDGGYYHAMAVKSDGTVWTWGYNGYGELGDGTTTQEFKPVQATGMTGGLVAAAGLYYSLALKNDGTIWEWGRNDSGQFGNGGTNGSTIPVAGPGQFIVPLLPAGGLQFIPVSPCRVADTRNPNGPFGGPPITGGTARNFTIPSSSCGIPSSAAAYSINVTVVPYGTLGYLTVWPTGQPLPLASTLNSLDGRVKANAATVPAGTNQAISVYASDSTDVILDINGYYVSTPGPSTLTFFPLPPCRVVDTRSAPGALGGPYLTADESRAFPVLSSSCNVPGTALAYSMNFTAVPHGPLGYLTTWPTGSGQPVVSTLNAPSGQITANAAIVPAGTSGQINAFVTNDSDLIIDINGYFAPAGAGGLSLRNLTPCRVLDTRSPSGSLPFSGTQSIAVAASLCGVPAGAQAYIFGATVVPSGSLGYLTLWPQGQAQPVVSTLNALDGSITSNMAIVPTSNGYVNAFSSNPTYLLMDIFGYFAP